MIMNLCVNGRDAIEESLNRDSSDEVQQDGVILLETDNMIMDSTEAMNHFNAKPGKYVRLMDRKAAGQPCPGCGSTIVEKIQYLGGACYFCPDCQH